jgi:hypothetical protein
MAKSVYVKDKNGTAVSGTVSYVDIPEASGSTTKSRFYAADGTLTVTQNGTVDVREQATVTVAVPVESSASGEANPVKDAPTSTIYVSEDVTMDGTTLTASDGTTLTASSYGMFVIKKPTTKGICYYKNTSESVANYCPKEIYIIYTDNGCYYGMYTSSNGSEVANTLTCKLTSDGTYLYIEGWNAARLWYSENPFVGKYIPLTALGASE